MHSLTPLALFDCFSLQARALSEENPSMKFILVLNKMDLCKPLSKAKDVAREIESHAPVFSATYYTSFPKSKGTAELADHLFASAQPGQWEFPASSRTDQSSSELVEEIVREKIFERVHQEIPYRVHIRTTGWTELSDGSLRIDLTLQVDTKQQKLILQGRDERMLYHIRTRAMPEIEQLLKRKIHLFMKVVQAHKL